MLTTKQPNVSRSELLKNPIEPVAYSNPEIALRVMDTLFKREERASNLVKLVKKDISVSDAAVYIVLEELKKQNMIARHLITRRNVRYAITEKGQKVILQENEKHWIIIEDLVGELVAEQPIVYLPKIIGAIVRKRIPVPAGTSPTTYDKFAVEVSKSVVKVIDTFDPKTVETKGVYIPPQGISEAESLGSLGQHI